MPFFSAARDEEADQDDPLQSQSHTYNIFDNINVPLSDVVVGPLLGKGGFGKVYKGNHFVSYKICIRMLPVTR